VSGNKVPGYKPSQSFLFNIDAANLGGKMKRPIALVVSLLFAFTFAQNSSDPIAKEKSRAIPEIKDPPKETGSNWLNPTYQQRRKPNSASSCPPIIETNSGGGNVDPTAGLTPVSESLGELNPETLTQVKKKMGELKSEAAEENPGATFERAGVYAQIRAQVKADNPGKEIPPFPRIVELMGSFDWRQYKVNGAVRNQTYKENTPHERICKSCWVFASVTALEDNYRLQLSKLQWTVKKDGQEIAGNKFGAYRVNLSEQALLDCLAAEKGACTTDRHETALKYLADIGVPLETDNTYKAQGRSGRCQSLMEMNPPLKLFRAEAWGYVIRDPWKIPDVMRLKKALVMRGPLVVTVFADEAFRKYPGGCVFKSDAQGANNHAVVLVGWDDAKQAWLIKNTRGAKWGDGGHMWIAWGSNGIGRWATWVRAPLLTENPFPPIKPGK
jgi:C1A family cysteine protease